MPYNNNNRSYTRGRKVVRRKKFTSTDKKQYAIAMSACKKREKIVAEKKYNDTFSAASPVNITGNMYHITESIIEGIDKIQRVGDSIFITSLLMRFELVNPDTDPKLMRMIVFSWNDDTAPVISQLLSASGAGPYFLQGLNPQHSHKVKIMHDKTFALSSSGNREIISHKYYTKVNRKCNYQFGSTNPLFGNLYLWVGSNSSINDPTVGFISRVRYTDQ